MAKLKWQMASETVWKIDYNAKNLAFLARRPYAQIASVERLSDHPSTNYEWNVFECLDAGIKACGGVELSADECFEAIKKATSLDPEPLCPADPGVKSFLAGGPW